MGEGILSDSFHPISIGNEVILWVAELCLQFNETSFWKF